MTKIAELRELSTDDLQHRVKDLDDQIFRLRIQSSLGQVEVPTKMRALRCDLARVKTLLRERELAAAGR